MQLKVKKLNPAAVLPVRGTGASAGLDLHILAGEKLPPGSVIRIPTGIAVEVPYGYVGLVVPRSSAFKKGLVIQGTIDADYRGEIFVVVFNGGWFSQTFEPGTALAQLLVVPYQELAIEEVSQLSDTVRGAAGFGSTGRT